MGTTGIWDSRNNRHATIEHETLRPCPFCGGMPRIDDDEFFSPQTRYFNAGLALPIMHMVVDVLQLFL